MKIKKIENAQLHLDMEAQGNNGPIDGKPCDKDCAFYAWTAKNHGTGSTCWELCHNANGSTMW